MEAFHSGSAEPDQLKQAIQTCAVSFNFEDTEQSLRLQQDLTLWESRRETKPSAQVGLQLSADVHNWTEKQ